MDPVGKMIRGWPRRVAEMNPASRTMLFGLSIAHAHNNIVHWRVPEKLSRKSATTFEFRRRQNLYRETLAELADLSAYQSINAADI